MLYNYPDDFSILISMKTLAVYCGSSSGSASEFESSAFKMGQLIASDNMQVIFGGGHVGLMGTIADGALSEGGTVIGVIPQFLEDKELGHPGITELITVPDMHQRKALIAEKADAFIALPGGIGTLEEIMEIMTWGQLGIHQKPFGLLNTLGFYNYLQKFLRHMATSSFLKKDHLVQPIVEENPEILLSSIKEAKIQYLDKWIPKP